MLKGLKSIFDGEYNRSVKVAGKLVTEYGEYQG
jgi:hypothetical protein